MESSCSIFNFMGETILKSYFYKVIEAVDKHASIKNK